MIRVLLILLLTMLPALAREAVLDEAGILDANARQQIQRIADDIREQTGKDLTIVTVKKVENSAPQHAQQIFEKQGLNGVLIYIAPNEHQLGILPGRNTDDAFPRTVTGPIKERMLERFRANDYGGGAVAGAESVRDVMVNAPTAQSGATTAPARQESGGGGIGWGWLPILFLIGAAFLFFRFIRGLFRGFRGGQQLAYGHGHGHGQGRGGYGSYPMGPGYPAGSGYPTGGSGGGFWSGMLGGLGGAVLGNTMYDYFRGHQSGQAVDPAADPGWGASDAGVAGGGDFGGWDAGGGGGDFGGGGDSGW